MNGNQKPVAAGSAVLNDPKTLADSISVRINDMVANGRLTLPQNYVPGNALSVAYLNLQEIKDKNGVPVLESCTKESVANALLQMCILGLNPAKNQCYFIPYGGKLSLFVSYFGKCAAIKRTKDILAEPIGTLIYEGDTLNIGFNELGERTVLNHETSWEAQFKGNIVGAYATVLQRLKDGTTIKRCAIMTMPEIEEAFNAQKIINPKYGYARPHDNFKGEFVKRTVINRVIKMILQTSNDDDLVADTLIETEAEHYEYDEPVEERVQKRIETKANTGEVIGAGTTNPPVQEKKSATIKSNEKFTENDYKEIFKDELKEEAKSDLDEYDPYA